MRTIGGYVLETKLGEGGMGTVYRASHPRFPKHSFAVKILRTKGGADPESLKRFERETQALARTTAHPNIVRFLGAGVERETPYYVMELAPGLSLDAVVQKGGPLEPARAVRIVRDITSAIAHAHANGVLHRDLKPENVIVHEDRVRVCDFGLARLAEAERLTQSGGIFGTPTYSAPEQLAGHAATAGPEADVYSLGAILEFLLTGLPPFESRELPVLFNQVMKMRPPAPSSRRPELPRELDAIVLHALEKDPTHRYPTARLFQDDLERFLNGRPVEAPATGGALRRARRPLAISGGLLLLLVFGAGAFLVWSDGVRRSHMHGDDEAERQVSARRCAQALQVLATAESRPADVALAAQTLASDATSLPAIFVADERSSPGDLLLRRAAALRAEERREAAAVFSATRALVEGRLAASPEDAEARALRALVALTEAHAPTEPFGTGRLVVVAPGTLDDLAVGASIPGRIGRRASWLAVDATIWRGDDSGARAQLERARKATPDADLERAFEEVLALPLGADGYVKLATLAPTGAAGESSRAALRLQRFFARAGLPGAIDDAALVAGVSDAVLEAMVATETPQAFKPSQWTREIGDALGPLYRAAGAMRPPADVPDEKRLADRMAESRENLIRLATAALQSVHSVHAVEQAMHVPQLGLPTAVAAAAVVGYIPSEVPWLLECFDAGTRGISRAGLQHDIFPIEFELSAPEFDAALDEAVATTPFRYALAPEQLADGVATVKGLKRLELLEQAEVPDGEPRDRLIFGAIQGMEAFARLSGPAALPFRARLRALVFPGAFGRALARLDLLRAEHAVLAARIDVEANRDPRIAGYVFVCAGAAGEPGAGRDLARELYGLALAWMRESGLREAIREKTALRFQGHLAELKFRTHYRSLRRFVVDTDFEPTVEDRARAASPTYEFRAPRLNPAERRR